MRWTAGRIALLGGCLGTVLLGAGALETGEGRLKLVEPTIHDDLDGAVSATVSGDGKFVYSAAWRSAKLTAFGRDPATGKLTHKQTILDADSLAGTTALALSPDGKLAIASAFQSQSAVLLERKADTGQLVIADVARDGMKDVRLTFPIDAAFSPDGKFVYVVDDHTDAETQGAVVAFRVSDGKLELAGTDTGKDG